MSLLDMVNNSLKDEHVAGTSYEDMIAMVKNENGLSDEDKALISTMLVKIATDEDTHNLMLKVIRDVLTRDNHKE